MKPRELIARAKVPGGVELRLIRHGDDHVIMVDSNELMSSRLGGSEEALATESCDRMRERVAPHLLIGGYGMGFTLRAALAVLGPAAKVTVAELVPEIVEWARGPMAALTAGCLDDPRVHLMTGDVAAEISSAKKRYDAILLDVDNGPGGLSRADNDRLYDARGLAAAATALRPGGVLAVWSSTPSSEFSRALSRAGYKVDEVKVHAHGKRGARHIIWMATRPA